ncbi:hypothetical protein N7468_001981 [Penicillium chermesinum]|uniref:AAA+ ATPase domain-containing protein n=1 Tax=Penicillium chermesinum TaxID=63820 RepID=A0A9W9TXX4_9EURO|nr:uncharacterized protein N7468_001981 [Penicillium chermesinum]KAJ5246998.1 hypothetical protein N7468_001981 [Penicillium chermesinum]
MSPKTLKRRIDDLEELINQSDPEDEDYSDHPAPRRRSRKTSRAASTPKRKKASKPATKRRRRNSDGIVSDDDDENPNVPLNARGVARRHATTQKKHNYRESPDDEEEEEDQDEEEDEVEAEAEEEQEPEGQTRSQFRTPASNSKVVTLRVSSDALQAVTRRMTRGTRDPTQEIIELTQSGRHAQPQTQRQTVSPEAERQQRGLAGRHGSKRPVANRSVEDGASLNVIPESENDDADSEQLEDDDDEDESPIAATRTRSSKAAPAEDVESPSARKTTSRKRTSQPPRRKSKESSDFEPEDEDEDEDEDDDDDVPVRAKSKSASRKNSHPRDDADEYIGYPRRRANNLLTDSPQSAAAAFDEDVADELADELADLTNPDERPAKRRRTAAQQIPHHERPTRNVQPVNYNQFAMLQASYYDAEADDQLPHAFKSPSRAGGKNKITLMPTAGPFGGNLFPSAIEKAVPGVHRAGDGEETETSDEDDAAEPAEPINTLQEKSTSGAPAKLGKVEKAAMGDLDPLGVDMNINFDSVGGLQSHVDQLKEMLFLPLLYPEIFQRFHIVPPRGVLFHGPPGTGKTLMARALANSASSEGRKVTFYMRKGADTLSKWVGEAERQLRLLFEEARKNQPSIIFFDEIDGLAPVRSSKQEQIHSTIVATLLALMDGMDGRGQVIVIGATNRPDSVDPALRRPGRFDREFYFPLPSVEGRRQIIDIHTKGWDPPLPVEIKEHIATITKGYGGADLRALCTEAALNAVQRRYPQIYSHSKDFMIAIKKMVPSSQRSTTSGASALPKSVEPLLRHPLAEVEKTLAEAIPQRKVLTALEEAQFEEPDDGFGFQREQMMQEFDRSRVFRPRMLIKGAPGMGQQYIAAAMLHKFDGLHVQAFDLPTLLSDSARSPEATVIQLFAEVQRHKPSVIYIPNIQSWANTVGPAVITTFLGLLQSLPPTDPILLLGVLESSEDEVDAGLLKKMFGYSQKNVFDVSAPGHAARKEYFNQLIEYIKTSPAQFPDPENRKKRKLEELEVAPPPPAKRPAPMTKEQIKAQKRNDRQILNLLKIRIQPVMDMVKKSTKFRHGPVSESMVPYLLEEADPHRVTSDLPPEERGGDRPYEMAVDKHGVSGLVHVASGKFFYNVDTSTMEKRLITKDAISMGDHDRILRARELQANVEVDMASIEAENPALVAQCEAIFQRELARKNEAKEASRLAEEQQRSGVAGSGDGELEMSHSGELGGAQDTESSSFGQAAQPKPAYSHTGPSQQVRREYGMYGEMSQNGPMTPMAVGSQPGDYTNEASTTQTTSYKRSSLHSSGEYPDLGEYPDRVSHEEHLPDTQLSSQASPITHGSQSQTRPQPPLFGEAMAASKLVVDQPFIEQLHNALAQQTSGCSIEQLEQINSSLMDLVWQKRGEWDRTLVAKAISLSFDHVLKDIQAVQELGPSSHSG